MNETAARLNKRPEPVRPAEAPMQDWGALQPHPLANLMPMMGDEEFDGLKVSEFGSNTKNPDWKVLTV